MAHSVFFPNALAALNIDSYNRSAKAAVDVDNGNLVKLGARTGDAGESEVFDALVPSTANGLTRLYVVLEPEIVRTAFGSGFIRGMDVDVRNFYVPAGQVFSCFRPEIGDIYEITADGLAGTFVAGTTTHVNATDTTGGLKPVWGNSQTANVFSMKLLEVTYISLATGAIDTGRSTAYRFEVVGL